MNVIDHRILIPTSPENIWNYISNIQNLPEWQVNVAQVSLLTSPTQVPGPGTRWRTTMTSNHEHVVMVTAWYDRLGYEYTIVDGVKFKSNKGQIRLQEIAEGTIVQWTFQFETTGLFGGFRNGMGSKRSIEQDMIDSLRMLWKVIDHKRIAKTNFEARSLMRDAPDVEARASYKARHPTVFEARTDQEMASENIEDDTRPRGVDFAGVAQHTGVTQPSELAQPEDDLGDDLSRFAPPGAAVTSKPLPQDIFSSAYTEAETDDVDVPELIDEYIEDSDELEEPANEIEAVEAAPQAAQSTAHFEGYKELERLPDSVSDEIDTSKISVFELFGLQKPSQTQEMKAVQVETTVQPEPDTTEESTLPSRYGLRARLRHKDFKLRRPY